MKLTHSSRILSGIALLSFPALAFAQIATVGTNVTTTGTGTLGTLFTEILTIINFYVVPVIFAIAFIVFLFGIYRYFIQGGGSSEKVAEGRTFLLWSIIGFVVMFSLWGIINLAVGSIPGLGSLAQPPIPTFTNTTTGTGSSIFPAGSSAATTGTAVNGQFCVSNTECQSGLCVSGECEASTVGGTSGSSSGTSGTPGSFCQNNTQCSGNDVCNDATQTCEVDGANVFSCADDSTPNAQGVCANGQAPTNLNGDQAPEDGSASANQSCAGNEDACTNNTICNSNTGMCQAIPQDGTVPENGSCLGNSNACSSDNDTCNDNDICSADTDVNNGTTEVTCNDGTTQSIDDGCSDDCGNAGTPDTCDDSDDGN